MRTAVLLTTGFALAMVAALLSDGALAARAQTPPTGLGSSMSVTAKLPVQAGASITVEALDPVTLKTIPCTTGVSAAVAATADPSSSQASFVISKASCVEGHSGNLRICWGANECAFFAYEDGKAVDLGLLSSKVVQHAPDTGGGADTGHKTADRLQQLSVGLLGIGGVGLLICALVLLRRRRHDRSGIA